MIGRLVVNGHEIDLDANTPVPNTFSIADVKNPETRRRSSSKQITLPGTQNNMDFFSSTYQLSLSNLSDISVVGFKFDPTIRVTAKYYGWSGKPIFDGLLQLLSVEILNGNYTFNVALFSNFIDLFEALDKIKVAELGWNEYNHTLNNTNIKNSWDTSVYVDGIVTPNFTAGVPDAFGYLYALCDYGYETNLRDHKNNNLMPYVYRKEIVEKCFAVANQTINSTFMDTERFKRMVFGFGGGTKVTVSPTEVANRRVNLTADANFSQELRYSNVTTGFVLSGTPPNQYTYGFNQTLVLCDPSFSTATVVNDTLTQLDTATGEIQIARTGNYSIRFAGTIDINIALVGTFINRTGNFGIKTIVSKNGAQIGVFDNELHPDDITFSVDQTLNLSALIGDIITVEFVLYSSPTLIVNSTEPPSNAPYFTYDLVNSGAEFIIDIQNIQGVLVDGDTVNIANFIPDMLCTDFLKGIITEYNLYMTDPDLDGVVSIEPLDDFYNGTDEFDDWSLKVDHSKKQTIKPASNIEGKIYGFRFAQDDDYYNKFYRDTVSNGVGYGDYNYQVQSTFQQGERVYQLPWAQTVPVEIPGTNIKLPTIISIDTATNVVSPFKGKPRCFYYQGLTACDSWVLRNSGTLVGETLTSYPACSHIDSYTAPIFDWNFAPPSQVWWTTSVYTGIGLFSEYHEKFVKEITGKDAKIYSPYVYLNDDDVQLDKLRTFAMINGVLYRKNIIHDYDDRISESTLVELVRIIEGDKRRDLSTYVNSVPITGTPRLMGGNPVEEANGDGVLILRSGLNSVSSNSNIKYG
jgi:hypothetical protein